MMKRRLILRIRSTGELGVDNGLSRDLRKGTIHRLIVLLDSQGAETEQIKRIPLWDLEDYSQVFERKGSSERSSSPEDRSLTNRADHPKVSELEQSPERQRA